MSESPVPEPKPRIAAPVLDLGRNYAVLPGRHDVFKTAEGEVRSPWSKVLTELGALDGSEYARRTASARRMIRDNGVTYNVYDEAGGQARPWDLDIWPMVISTDEWAALEAGVAQRAQLNNAILQDVYGPQSLVAEGLLPAHLVQGHPQFLRPLMGVAPPGGVYCHLYAADLTRDANGRWVVMSERLDAPSGAGYALENRIVVSQTFPELFRDAAVRRLATFFHSFREGVMGLSWGARPRAVLLTAGPYNEAYFEHAYLARYLGLTLVEGQDLTALDNGVFLKTLSGLERVDVIFRRVDSDFADPLELRNDSALGVPGLVEAARSGRVVIANALGNAVAEAPAIAAFAGGICQRMLGEPLRIPGPRTLWLGNQAAAMEAMSSPQKFVFREAFDNRPLFARGSTAIAGAGMTPGAYAELKAKILRRGVMLTAQEDQSLGTAPAMEDGRLLARPLLLRVYAAWTPNGYVVMPGGLTRVARQDDLRAVTLQSGAASKDTWVLSDSPVDAFSLLRSSKEPLPVRRVADEAPSRAMDNLFWLGRYSERAEDLVRNLRAIVLRLGDDTGVHSAQMAAEMSERLLSPMGRISAAAIGEAHAGDITRLAVELDGLVFGQDRASGLQTTLRNVHRTAWIARDRLSVDTWRAIVAMTGHAPERGHLAPDPAGARSYLDNLVQRAAALSGLSSENMTRTRNWLFLELGRRIERALSIQWLVRQVLSAPSGDEEQELQMALEIADSGMTYRSRYLGVFQSAPVLDLLLLDESNPRSMAFQINRLRSLVAELPRANPQQARGMDKELVAAMHAQLRRSDPRSLAALSKGARPALIELCDAATHFIPRLSDEISQTFFRHGVRRRMGSAPRGGVR
jgi:uncharacterized circularly permuted ATP-grasp superfamily protein/uncharacterized alpha-E superfamily protein